MRDWNLNCQIQSTKNIEKKYFSNQEMGIKVTFVEKYTLRQYQETWEFSLPYINSEITRWPKIFKKMILRKLTDFYKVL